LIGFPERIGILLPKQALEQEKAAAIVAVLAIHTERRKVRAILLRKEHEAASLWKLAGRVRRLEKTF